MTPRLDHDFAGGGGGGGGATGEDLKTELRLGLPGSEPQEKKVGLTLDLLPAKGFASAGAKRGFSDAIDGGSSSLRENGGVLFSNGAASTGSGSKADATASKEKGSAKAQVVGWPPIRNYRKNTMATATTTQVKTKDEASSVVGPADLTKQNNNSSNNNNSNSCLYVKVSMDGAPYLRKVDLKLYTGYKDLSIALEKMFSGFTSGGGGKDESLLETRTKDLLNKSEYVLTYEDKDRDWMLVGDVPWVMFIESCKKLKIMKGSDAIGLAPRAKNQN